MTSRARILVVGDRALFLDEIGDVHLNRIIRQYDLDMINVTGPLAVLPILHLNGHKIAGPTVLARISMAS